MNDKVNKYPPFSEMYVLMDMIEDYKKYGRIIVAYDFDNTVYTTKPQLREFCENVCTLLKECSKYPDDICMVCFTCRDEPEIQETVIPFLDDKKIAHSKINEQVDGLPEEKYDTLSNKILYTIFLDDHCGLLFTYSVLTKFVLWLKVQRGEMLDVYGFCSIGLPTLNE